MNFYQFYTLLNEYGQSVIQALTAKFQKEVPSLTTTVIKSYIDRFDRIKNNLEKKDILQYTWRELENAVDGYKSKEKIKAGKIDVSVSDSNLIYNQNKIRIYLGKDKKSCVRYSNGYTFCIGSRGSDNMYDTYRLAYRGTPYFVFNDNLPFENPNHLLVIFKYNNQALKEKDLMTGSDAPFSVTDSNNLGENEFFSIDHIIEKYPWIAPAKKLIKDVEPELKEKIAYNLYQEYDAKKYNIIHSSSKAFSPSFLISEFLEEGDVENLLDFLNNKNQMVRGKSILYKKLLNRKQRFDELDFLIFYKNINYLIEQIIEKLIYEYQEGTFHTEDTIDDLEKVLKETLTADRLQSILHGSSPDFFEAEFGDNYSIEIRLENNPEYLVEELKNSKPIIDELLSLKQEYNKNLYYIQNASDEDLKKIHIEVRKTGGWANAKISEILKAIR